MGHALRVRNPRWTLGCLLLLAGCGGSEFSFAPVSGRVTLDGAPLADARVQFEPIAPEGQTLAGPGSYAQTDAQGRFELHTLHGRLGAVVGEHRVAVSTLATEEDAQGATQIVRPELIPAAYLSGGTLRLTVPPQGTDHADLQLVSTADQLGAN